MQTAAPRNPEAPSLFNSGGGKSTRIHPSPPDGGADDATVGDIAATTSDNIVKPAVLGTLIRNGGGEHLLIPQEDTDRLSGERPPSCAGCGLGFDPGLDGGSATHCPECNAARPRCQHCNDPLPPRQHTGGKPRRFCSDKCRSAHHAGCSPPSNATVKPTSNPPPRYVTRDDLRNEAAAIVAEMKRIGIAQELIDRTAKAIEIPEAPAAKDTCLLASQDAVRIKRDEHGNLLIEQDCWPDDGQRILIHRDYEDRFVDALTDFLGYGGAP